MQGNNEGRTKATKKATAPRKPRTPSKAAREASTTRVDPSPGFAAAREVAKTYGTEFTSQIGRATGRMMYRTNGMKAFELVSSDNAAIAAGLEALADRRPAWEVAAGLEAYCRSNPKPA